MGLLTPPKQVIQMDGHRDESIQGKAVVSARQLRLDLFAQSSLNNVQSTGSFHPLDAATVLHRGLAILHYAHLATHHYAHLATHHYALVLLDFMCQGYTTRRIMGIKK